MRNISILTVGLFLGVCSSQSTLAEAKDMEGFSASIGLNSVGSKAENSYDALPSGAFERHSSGNLSIIGLFDISYAKAIHPKSFIAIGATYDSAKVSFGPNEGIQANVVYDTRITYDKHYSLYVQPAYTLTESTAAFAKIGYHSLRFTNTDHGQFLTNYKKSSKVHGIGYNLGLRTFFKDNFYLQTECQFVEYRIYKSAVTDITYSGTSTKIGTTSGIFSLGWKYY